MKRLFCIGMAVMLIVVMFAGCSSLKYNEFFIVGKSMEEVIEWCGEPHNYGPLLDENGECLGYFVTYQLKEKKVGFFGSEPPEYLEIKFDLSNIATEVVQFQPAP